MVVLRIEHPVPSFEGWKKAFDSDPIGRKQLGVRRFRVYQAADDSQYALVDLDFDSVAEAEACAGALRALWTRVQGGVMCDPRTRILTLVDEGVP